MEAPQVRGDAAVMFVGLVLKSVEFLRAVVPKLSRVAVLLNPANPIDAIVLKQVQAAAQPAGIGVSVFEATSASQIEAAFAACFDCFA